MRSLKSPYAARVFAQPPFRGGRRWERRLPPFRVRTSEAEPQENSKRFVVGKIARRTLLVSFKCNVCEGRTDRMVNPHAWNNGTVFVQCRKCENWHRIRDNLNLIDEIRYSEEE